MNRLLLSVCVVLVAVSCNKNKPVAKKMEGEWKLYHLLKDDGSEWEKDAIVRFEYAEPDGKTYASWTRHNTGDTGDTVEITGKYCIIEKGLKVVLQTNTQNGIETDTAKIEDIDKKSMVLRTKEGVNYFKKIIPN